jgi:hypothetical protein
VENPLSLDDSVPVPEPPAEPPVIPEPAPEAAPAPPRPPRRRGRTTLIIAVAAILGVLAGAGAGYEIQYKRPNTPLPPLAQAKLKQPKGAAPSAKPLTAAEDTLVTYDGDLRKLLLKKPKGAKDYTDSYTDNHWMSEYDYAESYKKPEVMFQLLASNGFRRIAATGWSTGSYSSYTETEISLVQFRDDAEAYTPERLSDEQSYMADKDYAGNHGKDIPGSVDGTAWVYSKPDIKAGYLPLYTARALARHGNVMVDVWVFSSRSISMSTIQSLAKRQLERL